MDLAEPLWLSESLGVAVVDRMATVLAANPFLASLLGDHSDLELDAITVADHRRTLLVAIAGAGDAWATLTIGVLPDERGIPQDVCCRIRAISRDEVVVVVEPPTRINLEVIEQLAGMIDDLLRDRD
jgi:hypothetical protein